ncbi:glycoside hydrolase family 28 protein [Fulvivirga sp. M361]|nr:glycoside hydrolase family 28 protein [Fulvivirga sp. M361]
MVRSFINGILLILISHPFTGCQSSDKTWNVLEFGAIGDSATINTIAIQKAIDACSEAGGGTVLISDGTYLSGTILLKNNVALKVDQSAQLLGSENPMDYISIDGFVDATGQERGKCLVGALDVRNVSVTGQGRIDGRGHLFKQAHFTQLTQRLDVSKTVFNKHAKNRPFLLRFVRSAGIVVKDVELRQPAAWTVHYYQCSDILMEGVKIYSHANANNDGIDLDSSYDAIIRNCDIDSGDDAICFKTTSPKPAHHIEVSNCRLKSDWGTIKFGTESMGDFYDIAIRNCDLHNTKGGGIKILSVDGADIYNIAINSIRMENVDMPVFIRLGERLRTYRDAPKQEVGSINDVKISNVTAVTRSVDESRVSPPSGIFISGTQKHKIGKVHLENITVKLPGGGKKEHRDPDIEEMETDYPEFSFFGVLPAYGMYARHISTLEMNNVTFSIAGEDKREERLLVDVTDLMTSK